MSECKPCQPGQYGNKVGATSCQKCQGATISDLGSSTCRCIGLNRKYLSEIGACVCKTGFTPIDGTNEKEDGYSDCEKYIYEVCDKETQERDSNGKCRDLNDCAEACDGGKGTVQFNGICQCQDIKTVDEICPVECVKALPEVYFTSNGTIEILNKETNETATNINFNDNLIGQAKCARTDAKECRITAVSMTNKETGDFAANFDIPSSINITKDTKEELDLRNVTALFSELKFTGKRVKMSP